MSSHATSHAGHDAHHEDHHHDPGFLRKWVFSTDHKMIGLQYGITAMCFLAFGFYLMMVMRWSIAYPHQPLPEWMSWLFSENWKARWLQDGMEVVVSLYEGTPVGAELPKTVTLAVVEADAVVKGQTASSSYKPAIVEGGVRVMVPPHIGVGTRLVINTEDGTYMERAKD